MNKLLHAILDNDEKLVREVIEKKPSLILREGYSGRMLCRLPRHLETYFA